MRMLACSVLSTALLACGVDPAIPQNEMSRPAAATQSLGGPYAYTVDLLSCGTGVHGCVSGTLGSATCPDDWEPIQACINSNPGSHIYFNKVQAYQAAFTLPDFYIGQPLYPCGYDQRLDGSAGQHGDGVNLRFATGSAGFRITKNTTTPLSTPCGASGRTPETAAYPSGVRIENMHIHGGYNPVNPFIAGANGIFIEGSFTRVDNVGVFLFAAHGIEVSSDVTTDRLANKFLIDQVYIGANRGSGMYVHGSDSSAGTVTNLTANNNQMWGVDEESFLGNTYVHPHTDGNVLGAYRAVNGPSHSVFVNPYAETNQPPSQMGPANLVLGGISLDYDWSLNPSVISTSSASSLNATPTRFTQRAAIGSEDPVAFLSNGYGSTDRWGGFVATNNVRGNPLADSISFRRTSDGVNTPTGAIGEIDNGWWGFRTNQISDGLGLTNYPLLLSDSLSSVGPGWGWFPNGFYLGQLRGDPSSFRRRISVSGVIPTPGSGGLGDIVFNTDPVAGGSVGWVRVVGGAWVPFGPVGESTTSPLTTSGSLSAFFPGALSSSWTAATWTPDKPIKVTRLQAQAKTAPSGCGTAAVLRISDGVNAVVTPITASASSTTATQDFGAGVPLVVEVGTPSSGCAVNPADVNVVVTYRMSQ